VRDIDVVIECVQIHLPTVSVTQLNKVHPADDDGLWWFRIPGIVKDFQVESSSGRSPFLIEHDDMSSSSEAIIAPDPLSAAKAVIEYLRSLTSH